MSGETVGWKTKFFNKLQAVTLLIFLYSGHSVSLTSFGYVLDDLLFIHISF